MDLLKELIHLATRADATVTVRVSVTSHLVQIRLERNINNKIVGQQIVIATDSLEDADYRGAFLDLGLQQLEERFRDHLLRYAKFPG